MSCRKLLIALALILALAFISCTPANPDPIASNEDPPGLVEDPLQVIRENIERTFPEIDSDNSSARWIDFDTDYYLIEIESGTGSFTYIWADKEGIESSYAVTSQGNIHLEKYENGEAWFRCTQSEPWPEFPRYLVAKPGNSQVEERLYFKAPGGEQYVIGSSNIDYQCIGWVGSTEGIDLRFAYSLTEGGLESISIHPPKTVITESENQVTFRFEDVPWPKMTGEELGVRAPWPGMGFGGTVLKDIKRTGDYCELSFECPGAYSYFLVEDNSDGYITMAIRFESPGTTETEIYDPVAPGPHYAYVNEENKVALSTLFLNYPRWVSGYKSPQASEPVLSPDGSTIAYVCWDAVNSKWYLSLLEVNSKNETFIEISNIPWSFDIGAGIQWAPSQQYITIEDYCYPPSPFFIVDVQAEKILFSFESTHPPLWSPDCSKAAFVEIEGKFITGPSGPMYFSKLVVYDIYSGETTILVEGETGYHIAPERWTEQGAVVYKYQSVTASVKQMLDTQGGIYDYPDEETILSRFPMPPGFPEDLGIISASDQNSITGEWLVTVYKDDGTSWLYHYKEGEVPTRLVQGRDPVWLEKPVETVPVLIPGCSQAGDEH